MWSKVSRVVLLVALIAGVVGAGIFLVGKARERSGGGQIVASNFAGYDFARAVTGSAEGVTMLVPPGTEAHSYEPTPEDIAKIREAELFIYVGGESEEWIEEMISDNEIPRGKTLRLMDLVETKKEELGEGEDDEHIWTSPKNAITLVNEISAKMAEAHPERTEEYARNTEEYIAKLRDIDEKFSEAVASGARKVLVFGDRFPFQYFTDEYGLDYFAAFPGCAEETEASSRTVSSLVDKVREEEIPVVLKIELTSDKLAKTIAEETGAKVLELNSAHNISQEDFDRGVTYADIMGENVKVIREALK